MVERMSKICDVCGDKGQARNFGVITCSSCKTFFWRYGLKTESWICPSDGKCNINVMTRRMCRKCRLEKCFAVGMKKTISDYNGINQLESKRIEELLNASVIFNYPLDSNASIHKIKAYDDIFNNICADDKYALMKHGGRDVALIRCLKYYNKEIESFITPTQITTILEQQLEINIAFIARNFGAMTCESCKSFFRRNGLKNEISNCLSNGKCIINVMTRRLCIKCRLEKCLAVGMKSELIRSDEQNKCRKELIKENKSKHKPRDESQNCVNFSPNYSQNDSIISDTTIDEDFMKVEFNSFENNKNKTSVWDNRRQELPVIPVFKTISDYNGINQLESKRISELLIASNTIFKHPLQSNAIIHKIKNWDEFADKFKDYNELFIRLIIQFTKSLNGFNNICADDKYALMKCGVRDLTVIRADSNRII
ncbi:unnamed protein product [Medioppia subpectinata]|uniref:Nuclear receptor domain-containing protein n=1 Tax=Medioppia subpectinata TaxID=1979941 RepID=A0A7R9PUH7_9ACAR|nr:unnamed protein product [Medioppia subpectinata]CAG2101778.1 unnamed protein product [Medioppia subpectinata]